LYGCSPSHFFFLLINCAAGSWRRSRAAKLTGRVHEIAPRLYDIPHSTRSRVSVDTLLEWPLRYRRERPPRVIPDATAALIERLKRESPHRTGTALLNHLAMAGDPAEVSPSTLYRFLRSRGLTERQLLEAKAAANGYNAPVAARCKCSCELATARVFTSDQWGD